MNDTICYGFFLHLFLILNIHTNKWDKI